MSTITVPARGTAPDQNMEQSSIGEKIFTMLAAIAVGIVCVAIVGFIGWGIFWNVHVRVLITQLPTCEKAPCFATVYVEKWDEYQRMSFLSLSEYNAAEVGQVRPSTHERLHSID